MRLFVLKLAFFFIGFLILDYSIGKVFDYIQVNAKGGATFRDNHICDELTCDILLLGSSRCEHHYNPMIISDSLGMSCYNAGQAGNGIIVAYARYLMMSERKKPRLVVYDIIPEFDLLKGYDNHRYLTWLKPRFDKDFIKEIFEDVDKTEKYKMLSNLYKYNSHFIEIIIDYLHPISDSSIQGYEPLYGEMDKNKISSETGDNKSDEYDFDPLKLNYIEKLINYAGRDSILFTISPIWYGMDVESYKPLMELCKAKGVRLLDFANAPKYIHNDYFFKDGKHLNAKGADSFSRELINYLKY